MRHVPAYNRAFKGGHKQGMNKTEEMYAQILELRKRAGEIVDYRFEQQKFRLADKTFYTPDFKVILTTHMEFHEVKGGFITEKGGLKFKVVAEMYPEYRWVMVQYKNKNTGFQVIRET